MPISNSMRGCLPGQPVDDVENAERPPRSGWASGSCMHLRVAPIRACFRRVSGLRRGLLQLLGALGADLFPVDRLGLGQRLVDLRLPRDVEQRDDAGGSGRQRVLDLLLDVGGAIHLHELADAGAHRTADHARGEESGREDQPDQQARGRADHGAAGDLVGVLLDVELALVVAAHERRHVDEDRTRLHELLQRVVVILRRVRVVVGRDIQRYGVILAHLGPPSFAISRPSQATIRADACTRQRFRHAPPRASCRSSATATSIGSALRSPAQARRLARTRCGTSTPPQKAAASPSCCERTSAISPGTAYASDGPSSRATPGSSRSRSGSTTDCTETKATAATSARANGRTTTTSRVETPSSSRRSCNRATSWWSTIRSPSG